MSQGMERRKERSEYKDQALFLFFRSLAQQKDLVGLVLADEDGLLVASNLPRRVAEEIAAQAPYLVGNEALLAALSQHEETSSFSLHPLTMGGQRLYLCLIGQLPNPELSRTEGGVRRILGLN